MKEIKFYLKNGYRGTGLGSIGSGTPRIHVSLGYSKKKSHEFGYISFNDHFASREERKFKITFHMEDDDENKIPKRIFFFTKLEDTVGHDIVANDKSKSYILNWLNAHKKQIIKSISTNDKEQMLKIGIEF